MSIRLTLSAVCILAACAVHGAWALDADYRFPSRTQDTDALVARFQDSLLPGIIPREDFIQWNTVRERLAAIEPALCALGRLADGGGDLTDRMAASLLAAPDPKLLLEAAFLLLGHTRDFFVTFEDSFTRGDVMIRLKRGDRAAANQVAEALVGIGLAEVLQWPDLESVALGVLLGLETHRRKNAGGKAFANRVRQLLGQVQAGLKDRGLAVEIAEEVYVDYADGKGRKRLDFAVLEQGRVRLGIEANFYTSAGSKPSEIKRSYADVRRRLAAGGVALVWITDGRGYRRMSRSLRDAYAVHPNIYNFAMAKTHWVNDFAAYLMDER